MLWSEVEYHYKFNIRRFDFKISILTGKLIEIEWTFVVLAIEIQIV